MTQWCLHIGSEKTGSSHLQSLLALSRGRLEQLGICFPLGWAHDERCMRTGQVSAGNARLLARALSENDLESARRLIRQAAETALRQGATRIILASEWLLQPLSRPAGLKQLLALLREVSATSVSVLLVLRDPLDQCLSLYKHRAKRGTAGDIENWLATGYRLPKYLGMFRAQVEGACLNLQVRKYVRSPGALDRMFFEDWLGIPAPDVKLPSTVNPSLTLSELVMIRQMAEIRTDLVLPLYEAMLRVPRKEKVQGTALEDFAQAVAAQAVASYKEEWAAWNDFLPEGQKLIIPRLTDTIPERPTELGFSENQLETINRLIAEAATPRFMAKIFWRSRLRPSLGRVARILGVRK